MRSKVLVLVATGAIVSVAGPAVGLIAAAVTRRPGVVIQDQVMLGSSDSSPARSIIVEEELLRGAPYIIIEDELLLRSANADRSAPYVIIEDEVLT